MKFPSLLMVVFCWAEVCSAQIEGYVSDRKDGEVLPFTHVYHPVADRGVYTDINGYYRIEAKTGDTLQFSYVGYEQQTVVADTLQPLNVRLKPTDYALSEVLIRPGANPAHRIIHNAIAHRAKNNPDNRQAYSCVMYNRLTLEMMHGQTNTGNTKKHKIDTSSYVMMNEAVVRRQYKYTGNVNDEIIASHTSGFTEYQQPAFLQMVIQFFHFYDDIIEWKVPTKFYLNPIGKGSTSKYFFALHDTITADNVADTTFIISYRPSRSAGFDGLKGLLYINTHDWAIQSIVAEPADDTPTRLKIQQQYTRIDSVWFPSELSLEWFFENVANTGIDAAYRGKTYVRDIDLAADLSAAKFKSRSLVLADDAWQREDLIDRYRNRAMNGREVSTFKRLENKDLDAYLQLAEGATDNEALALGIFDFPLEYFVQENYYEGVRIGAGMYTNRHLSPWFSAGGYYGYGLRDRREKYGALLAIFPEKHLDSEVKLWWADDLHQMTRVAEIGASARRIFGKFDVRAFFKTQKMQTMFDYSFDRNNMQTGTVRNTEAHVRIRYAHNEERVKMFRRTQPVFSTQPIVYLDFYWGVPDCLGGQYRYVKTEAGIERSWYIRNVGHTRLTLRGGWNSADMPFPLTFTITDTEQSLFFYPEWSAVKFNVITDDVYSSDRYFNIYVYHDFGTLLGKTHSGVFRPRIAVAQSFGWSELRRRELHTSTELDILDMRRGYLESGLIVEDIIRVKLLHVMYLGLGGGLYGAYGGSVRERFAETLTPKIRITGTF